MSNDTFKLIMHYLDKVKECLLEISISLDELDIQEKEKEKLNKKLK